MSTLSPHRRSKAALALLALVAMLGAVMALTLPASADTAATLAVTRATTPFQTNVAPNGPLTGLHDGDAVTVNVTADGSGTPANLIYQVDVRLCRAGLNIQLLSQFNATGGNCITNPLSASSSAIVQKPVGAPNTSGSVTFTVGTGTETVHSGIGSPITCDAFHPCSLWVRQVVPTGIVPSGNVFVHYDLTFAGAPDAPVAPTAVTHTGGSATVSWKAPRTLGSMGPWPVRTYTATATPGGASCSVAAPATSCDVAGLDPLVTYTFGVTVTNGNPAATHPGSTSAASTFVLVGKGGTKVSADLAASNSAPATNPRVGAFSQVETITNNGADPAVGQMLLTVTNGATESAIVTDPGLSCAAPVAAGTGFTQVCSTVAPLAPAASLSATITLLPPSDPHLTSVAITNAVSLPKTTPGSYLDPVSTDNKVAKAVKIIDTTDLTASFTGATTVTHGGSYTADGTLTNSGGDPVYAKVTIAVGYGSETGFTADPGLTCTAPKPNVTATGYSRVCTTTAPLASGASQAVHLTVAPSTDPAKHALTVAGTAAKASGNVVDPVTTNNKSSLKAAITDSADLATTLSAPNGTVARASTITLSGTVTNNGPDTVTGRTIVSVVGGTIQSTSSDAGLSCVGVGTKTTCTLTAAIPSGTTLNFSIVVLPSTKTTVMSLTATSTASVLGGTTVTDPVSGNNVAPVTVGIV